MGYPSSVLRFQLRDQVTDIAGAACRHVHELQAHASRLVVRSHPGSNSEMLAIHHHGYFHSGSALQAEQCLRDDATTDRAQVPHLPGKTQGPAQNNDLRGPVTPEALRLPPVGLQRLGHARGGDLLSSFVRLHKTDIDRISGEMS